VIVLLLVGLALSVRIIKQYERVVLFEFGKVKGEARGPGLIMFWPFADQPHRVSLRIITMPIQSQGIITKDNVSIDVSAVAYYRVEDPIRSASASPSAAIPHPPAWPHPAPTETPPGRDERPSSPPRSGVGPGGGAADPHTPTISMTSLRSARSSRSACARAAGRSPPAATTVSR
jgi:hypothetical protein